MQASCPLAKHAVRQGWSATDAHLLQPDLQSCIGSIGSREHVLCALQPGLAMPQLHRLPCSLLAYLQSETSHILNECVHGNHVDGLGWHLAQLRSFPVHYQLGWRCKA